MSCQRTLEIVFDLCILQTNAVCLELGTVKERKIVEYRVVQSYLSLLYLENFLSVHQGAKWLSVKDSIGLECVLFGVVFRMVVMNEVEELCQMLRIDVEVV